MVTVIGSAKSAGAEHARSVARRWLLAAALIVPAASPVAALDAQLGWTPVQSAAGYRVYLRQNGQPYSTGINVGLLPPDTGGVVRSITHGLPNGISSYFSVTAYDASGRESSLSNELLLLVPATPASTVTPPATATTSRTATAGAAPTQTPQPPNTVMATASRTASAAATRTAATNTPARTRTPSFTPTPAPVVVWKVRIRTNAHAKPGAAVRVPVKIAARSGVRQLALRVAFDSAVVAIQDVQLSAAPGAGTLDADFATPGELIVSITLPQPMTAGGPLVDVFFTALGPCHSSTALQITSCVLDGGAVGCRPRDGRITVRCG